MELKTIGLKSSPNYWNKRFLWNYKALREILEQYIDDNVKNIFILKLLELVLSENIFEFDEKLFRQEIGAAMGGNPIAYGLLSGEDWSESNLHLN